MNQIKHRILIVDDNAANRELLEAHLLGLDCDLDFAEDGQQTLTKVAECSPDLILLDVMMPKLSGFEVCKLDCLILCASDFVSQAIFGMAFLKMLNKCFCLAKQHACLAETHWLRSRCWLRRVGAEGNAST